MHSAANAFPHLQRKSIVRLHWLPTDGYRYERDVHGAHANTWIMHGKFNVWEAFFASHTHNSHLLVGKNWILMIVSLVKQTRETYCSHVQWIQLDIVMSRVHASICVWGENGIASCVGLGRSYSYSVHRMVNANTSLLINAQNKCAALELLFPFNANEMFVGLETVKFVRFSGYFGILCTWMVARRCNSREFDWQAIEEECSTSGGAGRQRWAR